MTEEQALLDEREIAVLHWRCRRGLIENDLFIERFFETHGPRLTVGQARALTTLMDLPDNDLLDLLLRRREPADAIATEQVKQVLQQLRQRAQPPQASPEGQPRKETESETSKLQGNPIVQ